MGWWRLTRDFRVKADRAKMLMQLADRRREPEMLLQAHHCNWASCHAGDLAGSRRHIREGLRVYGTADCDHRPWLFGNHDAKVCAHGELAQLMWMEGKPDAALAEEAEALTWAKRLDHAGTHAHAFDLALLHRFYRRDVDGVRHFADRMIALAEERETTENRARGELFRAWALSQQGDPSAALEMFESAYRSQQSVGTGEDTPVYLSMYADILNSLGEHDRALQELHEVRGELERMGICNWAPEVWRLIGETTLLAGGAAETALTAYETAASVGEAQGATMLRLRIGASRLPLLGGAERDKAAAEIRRWLAAVPAASADADLRRAEQALSAVDAPLSEAALRHKVET